jgi:WD40 repeat protein
MVREMTGEHKPLTPNDFQSMLYACAFNSDGKLVATADKTGHIVVWETHTGKKVASMEAPIMYTWDPNARRHSIGGPRSVAFSPDSKLLAVGGTGKIGNIDHLEANGRIEVFNWEKSERVHEFVTDKSKGLVEHLEFHPEGNILLGAGGAGEGFLAFIDLKEKKVAHQEKAAMNIHAIASTDGMKSLLAVGHHKILHFKMA